MKRFIKNVIRYSSLKRNTKELPYASNKYSETGIIMKSIGLREKAFRTRGKIELFRPKQDSVSYRNLPSEKEKDPIKRLCNKALL